MSSAITLKVVGLVGLRKKMADRKKRLKNFRTTNKKAAIVLHSWVMRNFKAEGALHDNSFGPWKKLAPATIRRRRGGAQRGLPKAVILQDTGQMKGGMMPGANNRFGWVKSSINTPYAVTHEHGRGKVPQRKILPTVEQGSDIVFPVFRRHVKLAIAK